MRIILYQIILLLAGIFLIPQVTGQNVMNDVDTVAFFVPNMHKNSFKFLTGVADISELFVWGGNLYQFSDGGAKEIQYGDLQSTFFQSKADPALRNMADGAMTLVTGTGFNSIDDGNFEISGIVKCNDTLPDWNVLMFCEGYMETERERVREGAGYVGVSTNQTYVRNWDKNATGILIEGNDTIGFFGIIMNPREDSLLKSFSADLFPNQQASNNLTIKSSLSAKTPVEIDFGIAGTFREKNFFVISNGTDRKTWIFMDNVLMSMFQEYKAISRKYQIMPYLLVNKNIPGPDRRDQVRIAIMSRCLNAVLN
jgi:hypothetical protein